MPYKKSGGGAKQPGKKTAASAARNKASNKGQPSSAKNKSAAKNNIAQRPAPDPSSLMNQIIPYILGLAAVIIGICLFSETLMGYLGKAVQNILFGLFAGGAVIVPLLILNIAFFWKRDIVAFSVKYKIIFSVVCLLFVSVLIYIINIPGDGYDIKQFWHDGLELKGGGAAGGTVGWLLYKLTGKMGTVIISAAILSLFTIFLFGLTPHEIRVWIAYKLHEAKAKRRERLDAAPRKFVRKPVPEPQPLPGINGTTGESRSTLDEDMPAEELQPEETEPENAEETFVDAKVFDAVLNKQNGTEDENPSSENESAGQPGDTIKAVKIRRPVRKLIEGTDFSDIFDNDGQETEVLSEDLINRLTKNTDSGPENEAELTVTRAPAVEDKQPLPAEDEKAEQEYIFPPVSLLTQGTPPLNIDISEELQSTAKKLVDTLASFKVRTKIVNVSRGPTITRYELAPDEGVRVRQIVNLVDDISLNLATTGVRIEAPIPGKQAVGIEVPNRVIATVYLRELIEDPKFQALPSRISVSLGDDVAGEPVYVDISKMPHLLIAGATGMGKSVCINSMIVSLLYKASPEEVKLILVDPKKVELNIYNGLPHLLVPVVSDAKKAAGALQWAVTEMERRFTMIEEVGMRDLRGYNSITKNDPEKEFLPQIVIIIDELSDLMMTAPDDVEESICRLAQKARAAGMHLIIGTQRPSVDVITGLIKANIPSRIAFTVASQIDSRTIIDIAGAEKLIGRGDMLYAPVGAPKPIRVQGAYVSENEIEAIISFIKDHYGTGEYDSEVIDSIEREAARCGQTKKGALLADEGDESDDPMLKPAIELAVESGKISTSLIQRRLQLGYGRAAKLIDRMEKMGIVSPPDGQRPRTVLISRQQFMEMVLNKEEI